MQPILEKEVRILDQELQGLLGEQFDFLHAFASSLMHCSCCGGAPQDAPPRIFINGLGDFVLYNHCRECGFPLTSYLEMSYDPDLHASIIYYWMGKLN